MKATYLGVFLLLLLSTICSSTAEESISQEKPIRILLVGNSFTESIHNGLNTILNQAAKGNQTIRDRIVIEAYTPPGVFLSDHLNNAKLLQWISQGNWTYVVYQEQSQAPGIQGLRNGFHNSLSQLIPYTINKGAKPFLLMTWGKAKTDPDFPEEYPDFETMQQRITGGYIEAAKEFNTTLIPVGTAWHALKSQHKSLWSELYSEDLYHASAKGSLLSAMVVLSIIAELPPIEPATLGLDDTTFSQYQQAVSKSLASVEDLNASLPSVSPVKGYTYLDYLLPSMLIAVGFFLWLVISFFPQSPLKSGIIKLEKNLLTQDNHTMALILTLMAGALFILPSITNGEEGAGFPRFNIFSCIAFGLVVVIGQITTNKKIWVVRWLALSAAQLIVISPIQINDQFSTLFHYMFYSIELFIVTILMLAGAACRINTKSKNLGINTQANNLIALLIILGTGAFLLFYKETPSTSVILIILTLALPAASIAMGFYKMSSIGLLIRSSIVAGFGTVISLVIFNSPFQNFGNSPTALEILEIQFMIVVTLASLGQLISFPFVRKSTPVDSPVAQI